MKLERESFQPGHTDSPSFRTLKALVPSPQVEKNTHWVEFFMSVFLLAACWLPGPNGMHANILQHTLSSGRVPIMVHFTCRLLVSSGGQSFCRRDLKVPQCPLHLCAADGELPTASFAVINGDGDNCSFISRSGTVCVSTMGSCTGPQFHSHSEDPFWR